MAEWGRKDYAKRPSRMPVWTLCAILLTPVLLAKLVTWQYERSWTAAERLYLTDYLKSGALGQASAAAAKYTLLEAVVGMGRRLVTGNEIAYKWQLRKLRIGRSNSELGVVSADVEAQV